ncbi:uncharacterized protein KD926_007462 [Aspergillus affinis]|uniref:uncharacterized protein n=1 Tax=Aspergillus affinis TaxID=1070780 RepID=UPI0022FE84F3|nr:uncharacterized protein KD926_007462 [Aspergillus affinis]KAI9041046.1 hypothetical protein KD926_007462 [Aspergillus affinis]
MEDLHHTVRGADISEFSVMGVLVKLALHAVKQENCASKESIEFTKLCIARLDIPDMFAPVCTATEHICNYGERRLSGASHEVACGLVLPRQVQATFFLQDLCFLLKEIRRVCRICFDSSRSALQTILLSYHETIPTLIGEWLSQKLDPIQFGQTYQLYSLLGLFSMLLGHLRNGNLDSFQYTFDIAIQSADDVLGEIKEELGTSMLYGKLSWDGATYASVTFGACLDDLRKQLLHLQEHADPPGRPRTDLLHSIEYTETILPVLGLCGPQRASPGPYDLLPRLLQHRPGHPSELSKDCEVIVKLRDAGAVRTYRRLTAADIKQRAETAKQKACGQTGALSLAKARFVAAVVE